MDTWLSSNYIAENYVRSLVTPTFASAIASSVILGILAVCLYTSFKRTSFLPFFYYANASLLYMLSFIFILIFYQDGGETAEGDLSGEKFLHAALFIIAFGHFFVLLGLYRSLVSWVADGLGLNKKGIVIFGYISIFLSAIPLGISVAADALLVSEFYKAEESLSIIHLALLLKSVGAVLNVVLVLVFLCVVVHFTRTARNMIHAGVMQKPLVSMKSSVTLLVAMGIVTFLRFAFDVIMALSDLNYDPVLDIKTYYALVITAGIFMILMVYLGNITKIKGRIDYVDTEPTSRAKKMIKNFNYNNEKEEIVPLSRAPMQMEEH